MSGTGDDKPTDGTPADGTAKDEPGISRLNSITERVSDVTGKARNLLQDIREQAIASKTVTPATKKTLDGIMIDQRLTEPNGVLYKAKMIGSLSVAFHKGDKMAMDAMRDLKIMAKTSGRHKARIFLRISIQGVHILEEHSEKQIDIHDLDKISYLAADIEEKKVFAYIYNKQIKNKESGTISVVHRLFAIKSPKCELIMSNMKAVFHYMHDMRMSDNKPNSKNVDMAEAVKSVREKEEEEQRPSAPKEEEQEEDNGTGFDYGKLVNLLDCEEDIAREPNPEPQFCGTEFTAESALDPGPAYNLYSDRPKGNRLECVEDGEPLYSTVRKIKDPSLPRIEVSSEMGTVNPAWNRADEQFSFGDDDPFSLDKYNRKSSSSSESEEEITFGVSPPQKAAIPSAVFMDDYEWDVGEMRTKKYSDGHLELSESRERLSTVTKKAVASLERSRIEQQPASTTAQQKPVDSLIDFATFEDRLESRDAVDLFDSLTDKSSSNAPHTDDLLSIDFSQQSTAPKQQAYNSIDINALLGNSTAYSNTGTTSPGLMGGPASNDLFGSSNYQPNISNAPNYQFQPSNAPNYQPTYSFPVDFGLGATANQNQTPAVVSSNMNKPVNPFHSSKNNKEPIFDPFHDLINDAI